MFFILSKTISFLAKPVTLVIIALLLSIIFRKKKLKRIFFWTGLGLMILFTNQMISNVFIKWWEIPPTPIEDVGHHNIGIILTGVTNIDMEPRDRVYFSRNVDRVLHAMKLYKVGKLDKLLISGGSGSIYDQSIKEASLINEFLLENNVPEEDIIIEKESRNTYENAVFTARILNARFPDQTYLLITSATHIRRARACFKKAGVEVDTFSTTFYGDKFRPHMIIIPSIDALVKWTVLFKEITGMVAYKLAGYL